jgi:Kef-type K+ transport system membrane component KefB
LSKTLNSLTGGFLAPVFFAYIGLEMKPETLRSIDFVAVVLGVSVITKLVAGWWGGLLLGMSHREAIGLGCMLNGRGVMELVVASIAYQKGFIGPTMYSTLVLMGIVTTLLTPAMFSKAMPASILEAYRAKREAGVS